MSPKIKSPDKKELKRILLSIFIGICVFAVGGYVSLSLSPLLFCSSENYLSVNGAYLLGLGLYIAGVIAGCTAMIYSQNKDNK